MSCTSADVPYALLRIRRLPEGVMPLLKNFADAESDPVKTSLAIVHNDKTWLLDVKLFFPQISAISEGEPAAGFEGRSLPEIAFATAVQRYVRSSFGSLEVSRYW